MMNIRHFLYACMACLCSAVLASCEHRILTDPTDVHYVRVYLDEEIKNVNCGFYNESYEHPNFFRPANMRAALADAQTGEILYEGLLRNQGNDEKGNYLDGYLSAPAGDYHILMYQLGSPVTLIRHHDSYFDMAAYTNPVNDRAMTYLPQIGNAIDREKIMGEPEHILASRCESIHISHSSGVDTLRTSSGEYFTAHTIAKSYYLQLKIIGVEWVRAAGAVLSGMAGSSMLCKENGMVEDDPVHLFFSMTYADKKKRAGEEASIATLYTTFTTFGKIPDISSELTLNFEFTKNDGTTQTATFDITEAFKTPLAVEKQWILLDEVVTITKPENTGGMNPGIEGWKDENADLPM